MACIPPTLEGWVYIMPIHGPLDGPLYTRAQYTPTLMLCSDQVSGTSWCHDVDHASWGVDTKVETAILK